MNVLLITPPLLQPNTSYAATPLLAAWLKRCGHQVVQADLSLKLLLRLFSQKGVSALFDELGIGEEEGVDGYISRVEEVVGFLQGKRPELAASLSTRGFLPEGEALSRAYEQEKQLQWNFRGLNQTDRARYLSSLFLDDLAEAAKLLDSHFGFSRYGETLAVSLPELAPLAKAVEETNTLLTNWLDEETQNLLNKQTPDWVGLTVPFPGCLFGALRIARKIRQIAPETKIVLGGGYVNTELRQLNDPALFDWVDFVTLDSGFRPFQRLLEGGEWVRTFFCKKGEVAWEDTAEPPIAHATLPPPDYEGLNLDDYFGLFEQLNPVTRLWSDGRWNRLVLAHGCCWSRCAFCDTSIDYICRYDPASASVICDWIEATIRRSGTNGFHFVDEALPPDVLENVCDEILRRGLQVKWWGNIRFEKRFSVELVRKMAKAGCLAVSGGLETCHDRTLKLMKKGISLKYALPLLGHFAEAGILTHAYLMYGFPTQTFAEISEALETVCYLFEEGALHSAYWHRFALTAHSEIAMHPEKYEIQFLPSPSSCFAKNEIPFRGTFDYDLEQIGQALKAATYNYNLGVGFDLPLSFWFGERAEA